MRKALLLWLDNYKGCAWVSVFILIILGIIAFVGYSLFEFIKSIV